MLYSLLNGQHMRSRDGVAIDEGEKLLEDSEERPVGEHAHTLFHLHCAVGDGSAVHNTDQPETHSLPFRQSLPWVRFIELDSSSIHLEEREKGQYIRTEKGSDQITPHKSKWI